MTRFSSPWWVACIAFVIPPPVAAGVQIAQPAGSGQPRLQLEKCRLPGVAEALQCGTHSVFENRETRQGRTLPLRVVSISAKVRGQARPPVFVIVGGPGQTATEFASLFAQSWLRDDNDVILIDQRGTGDGHRLDCKLSGADDDLQGYLDPIFQLSLFEDCKRTLSAKADLKQYTTTIAMDDLDEVREALGYGRIYLFGASYGTRAIATYLRKYGANAAGALLTSSTPLSLRNPLHHARAAQEAFDGLVRECSRDAACRGSYPNLSSMLTILIERLREQPAQVEVKHPKTGLPVLLSLDDVAFGEAVRVLLYSNESARTLPLLLQGALAGDLSAFATAALNSNRGLRSGIRFGMLNSVVCSEDMARIKPQEIARETAGTFLGDHRIRQQMQVCAHWPRGAVQQDYFEPLSSSVPALLISGDLDPATPAAFGEDMKRYFSASVHLVVPGGHSPVNDCIASVGRQFLGSGDIASLDMSCAASLAKPPFRVPMTAVPQRP